MITLGIDSSTQGTKAIVYDAAQRKTLASVAVNYGRDLPEFGAPNGFLPNADAHVRRADPTMWLRGLELALARLHEQGAPMGAVNAIGGGTQQHAIVFLDERGDFACPTAHIWMDSSTRNEVCELNEKLGDKLVSRTGSAAKERFAAAQVMKFCRENPEAWRKTHRVHLLSSYLTSVLSGEDAPIEVGDGAGMNLLNLLTGSWDREICDSVADGLYGKLPLPPIASLKCDLRLSEGFARFGLRPGIPIAPFTGDNPASFIGCGGATSGDAVISLGTSDTLFVATDTLRADPDGCGCVFGNPLGGFIALVCVTNGSLARNRVRVECGVDWNYFDETAWEGVELADGSKRAFPFFEPETAPLHPASGIEANFDWNGADAATKIRAIVEGQVCNLRERSRWMGSVNTIRVTGGASRSKGIVETIKRVFGVPVSVSDSTDSVAIGGAVLAAKKAYSVMR